MRFTTLSGSLDFGFTAFLVSSAPVPILIIVWDVSWSGDGVSSISFELCGRPFPVEWGGRTINVMIPGYKYVLKVAASKAALSTSGRTGTIDHPRTNTKIGDAELTPRYGEFLG
jgi:hypothetical protein